jgi:hypothetical protein
MTTSRRVCRKCKGRIQSHEYDDSGLCRRCWRFTVQEHMPGLEMSGAEWENFMESE